MGTHTRGRSRWCEIAKRCDFQIHGSTKTFFLKFTTSIELNGKLQTVVMYDNFRVTENPPSSADTRKTYTINRRNWLQRVAIYERDTGIVLLQDFVVTSVSHVFDRGHNCVKIQIATPAPSPLPFWNTDTLPPPRAQSERKKKTTNKKQKNPLGRGEMHPDAHIAHFLSPSPQIQLCRVHTKRMLGSSLKSPSIQSQKYKWDNNILPTYLVCK